MTARRGFWAVAIYLLAALPVGGAQAFPLSGDQTVLPPGTELNEDALYRPTEVFHSEARGGFKSYMVDLGDLAFNSPNVLGGAARRAGMQRRRQSQTLHPRHVDPAGEFRHHRSAVQS